MSKVIGRVNKETTLLQLQLYNVFLSCASTCFVWVMFSSSVLKNSEISSGYTKAVCDFTGDTIKIMTRWNVPVAFLSPNNIDVNRYMPWWDAKTVLFLSLSSIFTFLYLLLATKVEKTVDSPRELMHSPVRARAHKSLWVNAIDRQ